MAWARLDSPIGRILVVSDSAGIRELWLPESPGFAPALARQPGRQDKLSLKNALDQVLAFLEGRLTTFDLPLSLHGTRFQMAAWQALRAIPYGQTRTYAQQAASMGRPTAARAVGGANGANPVPLIVPCHRVVGSGGGLGGFAAGLNTKRFLLDLERAGPKKGSP